MVDELDEPEFAEHLERTFHFRLRLGGRRAIDESPELPDSAFQPGSRRLVVAPLEMPAKRAIFDEMAIEFLVAGSADRRDQRQPPQSLDHVESSVGVSTLDGDADPDIGEMHALTGDAGLQFCGADRLAPFVERRERRAHE